VLALLEISVSWVMEGVSDMLTTLLEIVSTGDSAPMIHIFFVY